MKTFIKLLFLVAFIGIITGCSKNEDFYTGDVTLKKAKMEKTLSHGLDQDRFVVMKNYDNIKVHYRIIGKGPIDMVFIPGWTNPLTVYKKQFDYFRDKARCIYIDLPGTGLSDAPTPMSPIEPDATGVQYTMELMADAMYAVVKKEGLHKFVGVGFSMGPIVLGTFERNYPGMMYKLVVLDGDFNPWPEDQVGKDARQQMREIVYGVQLGWDEATKIALGENLIPPTLTGPLADELKDWGTYFHVFPSDILANTYYHMDAENANEPVGWMYPKLCFYSNEIGAINMYKVNLIYPNNTVYGYPGGGHCIQWMFHEEMNPIIWEFVKDRPGKKY